METPCTAFGTSVAFSGVASRSGSTATVVCPASSGPLRLLPIQAPSASTAAAKAPAAIAPMPPNRPNPLNIFYFPCG